MSAILQEGVRVSENRHGHWDIRAKASGMLVATTPTKEHAEVVACGLMMLRGMVAATHAKEVR